MTERSFQGIRESRGIAGGPKRNPSRPRTLGVAIALAVSSAPLLLMPHADAALAPAQPAAAVAPASFSAVVEQVAPAVVNVATKAEVRHVAAFPRGFDAPGLPEDAPFGDLFRRFFEEHGIPRDQDGFPRAVQGQGSGFIIDPSGYVVTNQHVVDGAQEVTVTLRDGKRYAAEVKGTDPRTDVALLKIDVDKPLPYVELGDSDAARVGDWVLAVGNPFGLGGSVTAGIISARGRDIHSGPFDDYLQIDAPINRGNSGGPLFDAAGKVIGMNTAIWSPSGGNVGIGFAVPASIVGPVVQQLKDHGSVERGWLGVQIQPVTEEVAESLGLKADKGALVASIVPDSPAARAGLQAGDVILDLNGQRLDEFRDLARRVAEIKAGTKVQIEVLRQGKRQTVDVVIGTQPEERTLADARSAGQKSGEGQLGLYLARLTPQAAERLGLADDAKGVLVVDVQEGSPAERARIRPGSLITMVGQQSVSTPDQVVDEVHRAFAAHRPSVLLLVQAEGESLFVPVKFAT